MYTNYIKALLVETVFIDLWKDVFGRYACIKIYVFIQCIMYDCLLSKYFSSNRQIYFNVKFSSIINPIFWEVSC